MKRTQLEKVRHALEQIVNRSDCRFAIRTATRALDELRQDIAPAVPPTPVKVPVAVELTDCQKESKLLKLSEAAALIEPRRGTKVWAKTIHTWAKEGWFELHWCNGWKVEREAFLIWAARAGMLRPLNQ